MKDKEKQIAELMKDKEFVKLVRLIENTHPFYVETIALRVYEKYQPKLPKDSVVLSRKEYEKLNMKYISALEQLENKSKETAEKYKISMMLSIQEMQKYLEITEEQAKILYHHNAEIAKQFSVDV